jgi:hypothetical protein
MVINKLIIYTFNISSVRGLRGRSFTFHQNKIKKNKINSSFRKMKTTSPKSPKSPNFFYLAIIKKIT